MADNTEYKFEAMISLLRTSEDLKKRLLKDPVGLLKDLGLPHDFLGEASSGEAFSRGESLIKAAGLTDNDTPIEALTKLGKVVEDSVSIEVSPFGFKLLETPASFNLDWTATGTVNCTLNPYDGCKADPDF